jgi:hypothetical protein
MGFITEIEKGSHEGFLPSFERAAVRLEEFRERVRETGMRVNGREKESVGERKKCKIIYERFEESL